MNETVACWDEQAASFDEEADHGLRDTKVRAAWRQLLLSKLPPVPATVADLGCGTGSLSCLLTEAGFTVSGVDLSSRMVEVARAKAAASELSITFNVGDASNPDLPEGCWDVVLVRHVLWALPEQDEALACWARLLRPDGRLLLIEGRWHTGGGLTAEETQSLVLRHRLEAKIGHLTEPTLWGGPIHDERYLILSTR